MSSNNGESHPAPYPAVNPGPVVFGSKANDDIVFPPLSGEETAELFGTSRFVAEKQRIDQEKDKQICDEKANPTENNGLPLGPEERARELQRWVGRASVFPGPYTPEEKRLDLIRQQDDAKAEKERRYKAEQKRWSDAREKKRERARLQAIVDGTKPPTDIGTQLFLWLIQLAACVALYFILPGAVRWVGIALVLFRGALDKGFDSLNKRLDVQQALAKMPPPDRDELMVLPLTWQQRFQKFLQILFFIGIASLVVYGFWPRPKETPAQHLSPDQEMKTFAPGTSQYNPIPLYSDEDYRKYPKGTWLVDSTGRPVQKSQ